MIEEEIKEKANMYELKVCGVHANSKLRQAYKDGFTDGYSDGYEVGKKNEEALKEQLANTEQRIFTNWCKAGEDSCQFLSKLEKENEKLKAQIERLKCCQNCKHWKWQDSEDLSEDSGVYYCELKLSGNRLLLGKCGAWEICE